MRGTRKRIWLLVTMVSLLMLALGAAAGATTGQDGPDTPVVGDPVNGTQVVPHGGYASDTNFCMQCHDVHGDTDTGGSADTGAYALMTNESVTATCETCHSVGTGVPPTAGTTVPGGPDPTGDFPGNTNALGTVSLRTVYDMGNNGGASTGHGLGTRGSLITSSEWDYNVYPPVDGLGDPKDSGSTNTAGTATAAGGGFYCATCHTPHGTYGQMVNNWVGGEVISYDWPVDMPTVDDPAGWAAAYVTASGTSWDICRDAGLTNCMPATIQDAEDQKVSLYGYKLLSAYPNHTYSTAQTYNTELFHQDSADWCSTCHVDQGTGSALHNHTGSCVGCHGNPAADSTSADFPHSSSAGSFLVDYPDALCINCHTPGSLP